MKILVQRQKQVVGLGAEREGSSALSRSRARPMGKPSGCTDRSSDKQDTAGGTHYLLSSAGTRMSHHPRFDFSGLRTLPLTLHPLW